ncbi:amiloride sensitive cation channel 4 A [Schistosoma japonicum]|nr:amiloride sensitive cation channel 4 A [Schistosoma japonicum]
MINLLNDTFLTKDQIKQMSHQLSSTLKSCQYGDDQCTVNDFTSVFTTHGWCYQFQLNFSRTAELQLILDPQEYDYIIPNKGYIGFYLYVQNEKCSSTEQSLNINNNPDQSVIVGPKFHSYISVQQQYFIRSENHFGTDIKEVCSTYHIQSVVQLVRLPIQIHLLQKFNVNLFKRNGTAVQHGIQYQQKAFLQIFNSTAYNLIKDLTKELYKAKQLAKYASLHIWKMYIHLKHSMKSINNSLKMMMITIEKIHKVMKFRYLLSNYSDMSTGHDRNTSSSFPGADGFVANAQHTSGFTTINCSHLITYYEEQISRSGEVASAALTRLDHVNSELHHLIRNNHFARLIFPKTSYPYTELSTSSMVSLSIRISKLDISKFYPTSTLYIDTYLKSKHLF